MYMPIASSRAGQVLAQPLLRQPNLHMRTLNTCESRSRTYISKLASNPGFPLAPNPERKRLLDKIRNGKPGFKSISKLVSWATSENSSPQSSISLRKGKGNVASGLSAISVQYMMAILLCDKTHVACGSVASQHIYVFAWHIHTAAKFIFIHGILNHKHCSPGPIQLPLFVIRTASDRNLGMGLPKTTVMKRSQSNIFLLQWYGRTGFICVVSCSSLFSYIANLIIVFAQTACRGGLIIE